MTTWYYLNDLGCWVPCTPRRAAELMACPRLPDDGEYWPQVRLGKPGEGDT